MGSVKNGMKRRIIYDGMKLSKRGNAKNAKNFQFTCYRLVFISLELL